ncbi:DUF1998 domain-containing protein [Micrococcus luteus]|uniref:DUF1998 domain-containing protein n=1 Tax=Micrococcus luteus TaxID=1270 RepID=UPI00100970FC|nr:DUF1998 domain-containing protein [Micrococcus luteus]QAV28835.1 hypothetical protein MT1254_05495 [Micrococcus luteus]
MRTDIRARRGQLITTYGIGSLFPAENSSYIVQGTHLWKEEWLRPVAEPRLARKLRVQGFRTPPATPSDNARPNIPVALFPRLFTCPNCGALGQLRHLTRTAAAAQCEMCDKKPVLTPSRFVVTCETGHLDDFPFYHWVHGRFPDPTWWKTPYKTNGHRLRLRSQGKSSGLGDLTASCSCGESRTMEGAFSKHALQKMPCGGKRLWLGFDQHEKCEKTPRALQRGASNVWFGATASAISIPPHSGRLAHVVASEADGFVDYSTEDLMPPLNEYAVGGIRHIRNRYRLTETFEEIAEAIARLIHPEDQPELSNHDFRFEEYQAILQGAPRTTGQQFESKPMRVPDRQAAWVAEVRQLPRLRVVSALHGFSRLTPVEQADSRNEVLCPLSPEPMAWLPASELLGEGLFLGIDPIRLREWSETPFARTRASLLDANRQAAAVARNQEGGVEPVDIAAVALHTLAHMVIDQLALDAGYPASSLKERLFVGPDMAGVLIYTAATGSAGSLGGVSEMARPDRLGPALEEALIRHSWCSADPVCRESTGSGTDGANLAACHNCLLLPETSCELFNTELDRLCIVGDMQTGGLGLLDHLVAKAPENLMAVQRTVATAAEGVVPASLRGTDLEDAWVSSPRLRFLVAAAEEEGWPAPELGPEIGKDAWTVDLAWLDRRIVVVDAPEADRDSTLRSEGWIVLVSTDGSGSDVVPRLAEALSR